MLGLLVGLVHGEEAGPGDRVFAAPGVIDLELTLTPEQFRGLTPTGGFGGFGPPGGAIPESDEAKRNTFGVEFPWGQGQVEFEGETLADVGLRFKGNFTYMASAQALKKPLKLDFNRNVKGQKLDGLTRVNLHTGVSDPTRLRESLSYTLFRDLGVPAPRTTFARVYLNVDGQYDHELVGVYTLVEEVNKSFLARHFGDGGGMLLKPEGLNGGPGYRGTKWKSYEGLYHPDSKPGETERTRLIEFTRLIDRGSDEEFARRIGEYLDIPAFLRFIAANALLSNLDSYLGFGHNYYLYLVPGREQFVFIPWDLDLSLAAWPAVGTPEQLVELSIRHPHAGKNALIDRLLAIDKVREAYLAIVRELLETRFTEERFLARLDELEDR
ncbi:MAG: CotH kinase family protein, partial [Planctomycetaceae bacterium]